MAHEDSKRHCLFCHSEIERDAILCVHCNSFQNWRRILILGSSFAALIVASISFLPVGISYIRDIMTPKNSNISARYRGLGGGVKGEGDKKNFQYTVLTPIIHDGFGG